MLDAKVKLFTKENKAKPKHKSSIESGNMQKLNRYFLEWNKLVDFIWFCLFSFFSRRESEMAEAYKAFI